MPICMYIRRCTTFIHTYVSPAHTTAFKNHPLAWSACGSVAPRRSATLPAAADDAPRCNR